MAWNAAGAHTWPSGSFHRYARIDDAFPLSHSHLQSESPKESSCHHKRLGSMAYRRWLSACRHGHLAKKLVAVVAVGTLGAAAAVVHPLGIALCEPSSGPGHDDSSASHYSASSVSYFLPGQIKEGATTDASSLYATCAPSIFADVLPTEYEDRGHLQVGEEALTVQPTVFAQMGVLEPTTDGFASLFGSVHDTTPTRRASSDVSWRTLHADDKFCDLGSGVGNVCLQALLDTPCRRAIGIEIIPSRAEYSRVAFRRAAEKFCPDALKGKSFVAYEFDITKCGALLNLQRVTVVFVHSWMFDDALMDAMATQLAKVSSLRLVVSSRPLSVPTLSRKGGHWTSAGTVAARADWNAEAPFHVYVCSTV